MVRSSSALEPRPNAASRSTRWSHSAPCSCHARAASTGSPNSPPLPATPWTSWTARPSTTSTAGRSSSRGWSVTKVLRSLSSTSPAIVPDAPGGILVAPSEGLDPVLEERESGLAGLLRVELRGAQGPVLDRRDEALSVGGPRHLRLDGSKGAVPGGEVPGVGGIRVDEVEALVGDAREEHGAGRSLDGRPAHVGHDRCGEPRHDAGPLPDARHRPLARLRGALEHHLHPDAHAQHGPSAGDASVDETGSVGGDESGHARVEVADARDQEAVRAERCLALARQGDVRADVLQGAHRTAHVAAAVVEDDDRCAHSRPPPWCPARPCSVRSARWAASSAMSRSNAITPRTDGSTSAAPSASPPTSISRPGRPNSPSTVTGRSTGAPRPERRTSASASSRTVPSAAAARSSTGNESPSSCGVSTTPRRGAHTSQCMLERMPAGWTVIAARPRTSKRPTARLAPHRAGRAASSSRATSYGAALRARSSAREIPVHRPSGATVTGTRPRRTHRVTAAGDPRTSTRPCPAPDPRAAA